MDLKQLETFAYVIKYKSFSIAAKKLYLTQPTISSHINSLEKELDVPLIVRTPREALPTHKGAVLFEYAMDILSLRDNAISACKAPDTMITGHVKLAASTIPYQWILPRLMSDFRHSNPAVSFSINRGDSSEVVKQIMNGKVELGMVGAKTDASKCCYTELRKDTLVVITPNTEPYCNIPKGVFPANMLLKYPLIIREIGSGTRVETERILRQMDIDPASLSVAAQLDDTEAIKQSVCQGIGISIISKLAVADYERFGLIRTFKLSKEDCSRVLYFAYHKSRPLSFTATAFVHFATSMNNSQNPVPALALDYLRN